MYFNPKTGEAWLDNDLEFGEDENEDENEDEDEDEEGNDYHYLKYVLEPTPQQHEYCKSKLIELTNSLLQEGIDFEAIETVTIDDGLRLLFFAMTIDRFLEIEETNVKQIMEGFKQLAREIEID